MSRELCKIWKMSKYSAFVFASGSDRAIVHADLAKKPKINARKRQLWRILSPRFTSAHPLAFPVVHDCSAVYPFVVLQSELRAHHRTRQSAVNHDTIATQKPESHNHAYTHHDDYRHVFLAQVVPEKLPDHQRYPSLYSRASLSSWYTPWTLRTMHHLRTWKLYTVG